MAAGRRTISDTILNGLITIAVAAICACGSVVVLTHEQTVKIDRLIDDYDKLNTVLNEVKSRSIANEVKISSHDASITRLQTDMDSIKYKLAAIPDRKEINDLLDGHYNKLSEQINRLAPK